MAKKWQVWKRGVSRVSLTDGRWIAAGTLWGYVFVWDTETYEKAFTIKKDDEIIYALDFSPDSTRLVTASCNCTTIVWDVALRRQVQTLQHENLVTAEKYSPQGDRIATNTYVTSVRVWDGNDGRLPVKIEVRVTPWDNAHLLWSNTDNHLFVMSDKTVKQFEASTGTSVWEWPALNSNYLSCIALPRHSREFIASISSNTLRTYVQSLSPDDQLLAIAGKSGEITISGLFHISNSTPLTPLPSAFQDLPPISQDLHPTFQEPNIQIDDAALDSWKHDQLENAEAILTAAALVDAEKVIEIQPSVFTLIAKNIAHVGKGERYKGYWACDIAFEHFHSSHVTFLLVKTIMGFMAGEHRDAISRVDDLIATVHLNSICYVAYMYLLLGNSQIENGDLTANILAWTGESGSYNSCLPAYITVFNRPATSHLPKRIPHPEIERLITASDSSSFDLDIALRLYDRLNELSAPWFVENRMKPPCIAFQLPPLSRTRSGRVYRANITPFGMVEIKARHDLSRMTSLFLIHPWLDTLLEREEMQSSVFVEDDVAPPPLPNTDDEEVSDEDTDDNASSLADHESHSHPAPLHMPAIDREMRVRRVDAYKRIAADSLITVQIQENFSLADILDGVHTLNVLQLA
ncbi:WD40 repeat-like protein [Imleria badia]|nr:WD40 repeat-like protein [Imleria badia]